MCKVLQLSIDIKYDETKISREALCESVLQATTTLVEGVEEVLGYETCDMTKEYYPQQKV